MIHDKNDSLLSFILNLQINYAYKSMQFIMQSIHKLILDSFIINDQLVNSKTYN